MLLDSVDAVKNVFSTLKQAGMGEPLFGDSRYKPVAFNKDNFHAIEGTSDKTLCFVDGGNQEIISAPNFSVQFVRVYANFFKGKKRVLKPLRSEFLSACFTEGSEKKILFNATIIPVSGLDLLPEKGLLFDSQDDALKEGVGRARISVVGGLARRFAEWAVAEKAVGMLSEGDVVIRDGTLQTSVEREAFHAKRVFETALRKNVFLAALAKTSTLFTTTGLPVTSAVNKLSPSGKWFYWPLVENSHPDHPAELFVVKLHEKARHAFRFEWFKRQKIDANVFTALLENASDPTFLGYPYGLIEADRMARVSNKEILALKQLFATQFGGEWVSVEEFLSASNAHDVLDQI